MPRQKTWTEVANEWDVDGVTQTGSPATVLRASHPDIPGEPRFVGGDECSRCHFTYPRDQLVYFEGRPFCTARGCSNDIKHFVKNKRPDSGIATITPLVEG